MEYLIGIVVFGGIILTSMVKILNDWERGVVLRLGRAVDVRGPGLIILIPFVERMIKLDTRTITMDVKPQDVITKDNVSMQVNAVVYFKVVSPMEAITKIEDYYFATSQLAQTTLRSVSGQFPLDDILEHRAEGEVQRAQKLAEASNTMANTPSALQLAYMQTLTEIAGDKSNTIIFPLPLDLFEHLMKKPKN